MPWVNSVPAIVHAWYLGNATGDAIADVLFGKVNPSGKLSITFPARLEDVPSFGYFNVEDGKVILHRISDILCSRWRRFAMPRIYLWSVAYFAEMHLSWEPTVSQGYKHYQHKSVVPAFSFGYMSFMWPFHLVVNGFADMACPTRLSGIRV